MSASRYAPDSGASWKSVPAAAEGFFSTALAIRPRRFLAAMLWIAGAAAPAGSFRLSGGATSGSGFHESFARAAEESGISAPNGEAPAFVDREAAARAAMVEAPAETRRPHTFWIGAVSFVTLAGSAENSFTDGPNQKFHFTNEGYLGQNTYAGGADKASHFVSYYVVAKLLSEVYAEFGLPVDQARLLGAGVSMFAGFVTELGDGRGHYGFSYEDLTMDTLGAATYLGIAHYGLGDLVGFSAGLVPSPPAVCCPHGGFGTDYSELVYSGDLKVAGLGHRAHFDPGPARFLLVSLTYGSKGYPYADPAVRERQIGIFLGVNFVQILREAGVPEEKWWGKIAYFLFDVIRIPYTQIGYQYDLNQGRWHGPSIDDRFPGGGRATGMTLATR